MDKDFLVIRASEDECIDVCYECEKRLWDCECSFCEEDEEE